MDEMNEKDTKELLHGWASRTAAHANSKAKEAAGWKRWLWALGAIVAGAVAWFTTGCTASYSQTASGDISANVTIVQPVEVAK